MWETQKAELRKDIRSRLKAMPEEEKRILDREIAERVLGLPEIAETKAVYGYASLSWEAGTGEILEELRAQKYIICLPKVTGETMEFFVTESEQDLLEGSFHIMEPKNGCRKADETRSEILRTAPILVPGMGFVETGARLGKGGGFYDRYLEQYPGALGFLGIRNEEYGSGAAHHNEKFDVDENVLPLGVCAELAFLLR